MTATNTAANCNKKVTKGAKDVSIKEESLLARFCQVPTVPICLALPSVDSVQPIFPFRMSASQ